MSCSPVYGLPQRHSMLTEGKWIQYIWMHSSHRHYDFVDQEACT